MDLSPGGRYHHRMKGEGFEMWGRFVWREISPIDRLETYLLNPRV